MNIKITISFNGAGFFGWQSQKKYISIQDTLETALEAIYKQKLKLYGSSRTDRAVNAINYIANFHPPFFIEELSLAKAINFHVPQTILVKSAEYVSDTFHARYSAKSKTYVYRIYNNAYNIFDDFCFKEVQKLDIKKMQRTADIFKGKHDFRAFSIYGAKKNTECDIFYFRIRKRGNYVYFIVKGDRFLHKMVRFLVGGILDVGKGKLMTEDLLANLKEGKRINFMKPVTGNGLFLKRVNF